MQIKSLITNIILLCVLIILSETNLFAQATIQTQQSGGGEKIDIGRFSDNTAYENASQFYRLKNFDLALELFSEYLEIYINGLHRKEAYKKTALIYFEQFNYIKSIKALKSLYEEFSNSEEGIEAYFMTGICYQKMGFLDNAKQIFKSLIEENPESNFVHQAQIKLDLIEILENG